MPDAPNPRADLRAAEDDLWAKALGRLRRVEAWRFWVNVTFVVGGGAVVGVGRVLDKPASDYCTIGGVIFVLIGGAVTAFTERKRGDVIDEAKAALAKAKHFLDERGALETQIAKGEALDERRRLLLTAQGAMADAAVAVIARDGRDIVRGIEIMLDVSVNALAGAIGFEPGELWTFSIFQRKGDAKDALMERIVARWADRSLENAAPRSWRINEGYTGAAWGRDGEVIVEDTHDTRARDEFRLPLGQTRSHDEERYRSVAAVPVRLPGSGAIWGVVTATTNRTDRFKREPTNARAQSVQTVRAIAQMIELLVTAMPAKG